MNLASEVSSVLSELDSLKAENAILKERGISLETENDQLRHLVGKTGTERDFYLRKAESMQSILTQTGTSLVSAMKAFHAGERELQETAPAAGSQGGPSTAYISDASKKLQAVL